MNVVPKGMLLGFILGAPVGVLLLALDGKLPNLERGLRYTLGYGALGMLAGGFAGFHELGLTRANEAFRRSIL